MPVSCNNGSIITHYYIPLFVIMAIITHYYHYYPLLHIKDCRTCRCTVNKSTGRGRCLHITHFTSITHTPYIITHTPHIIGVNGIIIPIMREHPGRFPEPTRVLAHNWHYYAYYAYYAKGVHNNTFYAIYAVYAVYAMNI